MDQYPFTFTITLLGGDVADFVAALYKGNLKDLADEIVLDFAKQVEAIVDNTNIDKALPLFTFK